MTASEVGERVRRLAALVPRPRTSREHTDRERTSRESAGPGLRFGTTVHPRPPRWRRVPEAGRRWRSRPLLAAGLRALALLIPAACALASTMLLSAGVPTPDSLAVRLGWWAILLAVSTVVALATERQTRRLLPLALLYKLTLLFPDEAPSRYRMARAAGNPQRLRELAAGTSPRSRAATHVLAWVAHLSRHDRHTRGHSERVRVFTDLLAQQLDLPGPDRDKLRWAALLHDIGKLRVPAPVLNKPGKPSTSEWDLLREHPATGLALVGPLAAWLGPWAGGIADHHERYDGTGYPNGRAGREISLAGRIVAVADAYETMTATRSYKKAMAAASAREELARCAGTHFDPDIVRAFLGIGLPRMLFAIGPLSFLIHLPFLARLPDAGLGLVAMAGQAATPVAAGLTAASVATAAVVAPAAASAPTTVGGSAASSSTTVAGGAGGTRGSAPGFGLGRSLEVTTQAAQKSQSGRSNGASSSKKPSGGATGKGKPAPGGSASTSSKDKKPTAGTTKKPTTGTTKKPSTSGSTSTKSTTKPSKSPMTKSPMTKSPKSESSTNKSPTKSPTVKGPTTTTSTSTSTTPSVTRTPKVTKGETVG